MDIPAYLVVVTGTALASLAIIALIWDLKRGRATSLSAQNQAWIRAALQKETVQKPLKATDPAQARAIEHEFNKVFMFTPQDARSTDQALDGKKELQSGVRDVTCSRGVATGKSLRYAHLVVKSTGSEVLARSHGSGGPRGRSSSA